MTYKLALYYSRRSEFDIANDIAESKLFFDPDVKKIKEQIKQHKEAIHKLELKLGERHAKLSSNLLPEAIKAREEAISIIELHKQMDIEFDRKLSQKAL